MIAAPTHEKGDAVNWRPLSQSGIREPLEAYRPSWRISTTLTPGRSFQIFCFAP